MVIFLFYAREVKRESQSKPKNKVLGNIYNLYQVTDKKNVSSNAAFTSKHLPMLFIGCEDTIGIDTMCEIFIILILILILALVIQYPRQPISRVVLWRGLFFPDCEPEP